MGKGQKYKCVFMKSSGNKTNYSVPEEYWALSGKNRSFKIRFGK